MSVPQWMEIELTYPGTPIAKGQKGTMVQVVQEWLGLHSFGCGIDGDFGPATETQVNNFQTAAKLSSTGVVDQDTFDALVAPMMTALAGPALAAGATPNSAMVAVAQHHLASRPREMGGDNRGPWVRLYMQGNDGAQWAWCAGFACFIMDTAYKMCGATMPLKTNFGVDNLVSQSKKLNRFQSGKNPQLPPPGSLFFVRSKSDPNDWIHTGVVTQSDNNVVATIEGNTNGDGSANGYEVWARQRAYTQLDFFI